MSVKVTIGESKTQEAKPFPKLMKTDGGRIVFMISSTNGFQLNNAVGEDPHFYTRWNMGNFTDFNEPITLQND